MKKILIPANFSELTDYAYQMAFHLSEKTGATIDILSVVPGPQGAYYDNEGMIVNSDGSDLSVYFKAKEEIDEKLVKWVKGKKNISSFKVKIGRVEKDIIQYAEKNKVDLIVMGTEGAFGNSGWISGSHTQRITNEVSIPVLSLKCDRSDIDLKEIVLVSDFFDDQILNLDIIKDLQNSFNSKLVLLKIKTPNHKMTDAEMEQMMEGFVKRNELNNVELNIYDDVAVESGIGKFCAERDIDLIALGTHQKSGFSKLFKKNISDDVVNNLYHPILTFPLK